MPRLRARNNDGCFEFVLFAFFFYTMFDMWTSECSFFFNTYSFGSYIMMTIIRKY